MGLTLEQLRKMNSDVYSMEITDGMKTVCKLKDNPDQKCRISQMKGVFHLLKDLMMRLWKTIIGKKAEEL